MNASTMRSWDATRDDAMGSSARSAPRNILFVCGEVAQEGQAFKIALQLAKLPDTALRCACILESVPVAADLVMETVLRQDLASCTSRLAALRLAAAESNVAIDVGVAFGMLREQIVRQIRDHGIDLLIMPAKRISLSTRLQQWFIARLARQMHPVTILTVSEDGEGLLTI